MAHVTIRNQKQNFRPDRTLSDAWPSGFWTCLARTRIGATTSTVGREGGGLGAGEALVLGIALHSHLIDYNVPTCRAFAVSWGDESRTIMSSKAMPREV